MSLAYRCVSLRYRALAINPQNMLEHLSKCKIVINHHNIDDLNDCIPFISKKIQHQLNKINDNEDK